METNIQKWGNSLGVRLPQALATKKSLAVGCRVLVTETENGLAIEVIKKPTIKLDSLLNSITPKNQHREVSFGNPIGKEIW